MSNLLELNNINLTYQTLKSETKAIDNISFCVKQGEFVSIVGPSGSGKTTILSIISGLLKATSGSVFLDGEKINGISTNVRIRVILFSFQIEKGIFTRILRRCTKLVLYTQESIVLCNSVGTARSTCFYLS